MKTLKPNLTSTSVVMILQLYQNKILTRKEVRSLIFSKRG